MYIVKLILFIYIYCYCLILYILKYKIHKIIMYLFIYNAHLNITILNMTISFYIISDIYVLHMYFLN